MRGSIEYGSEIIRYEIAFRSTRRTLAVEVHPDQRVIVIAPAGCPEDVVAARIRRRAAWILKQISRFRQFEPRSPKRRYVSGESHFYLGRKYRLKLAAGARSRVGVSRGYLTVTLPGSREPRRVLNVLQAWYRERAKEVFADILSERLPTIDGVRRPRIVVRALKTRWGSLSHSGTMTLNIALVQTPRQCIEYVVTHELCHLRHSNHGSAFYKLLKKTMPDWEKRKKRLETALL